MEGMGLELVVRHFEQRFYIVMHAYIYRMSSVLWLRYGTKRSIFFMNVYFIVLSPYVLAYVSMPGVL